ncbi:MAG: DNA polymerase III subunit delta [Planctomycetota bacterium]|jgi:DNA polymerase-3 subunit delta
MPTLKALELEERLDEAVRAPLCVLVGADDSLRSRCLRLVKQAALADLPGSTLREFEGSPEACDVFDELNTVPFLGLAGRRLVVVESGEAFLRGNAGRLLQYLQHPATSSMLVVCLDRLDPKKPFGRPRDDPDEEKARQRTWRALAKAVRACTIVDCKTPSWREARQWVRSRGEQIGKRLTPRAVDLLVEAIGPHLMALEEELEKLAAYVGQETTIAERDVGEVVPQARARSAFDLADAVSRGDVAQSLALCGRLLLAGERRERIISVLALQLRRLWQAKRLCATGVGEAEVARQTGMPDFAVRRSMKVLPTLSEERLARQFEILSAADVESKTTSLRSQEEKVWLESLLARLCSC